MTRSLLVDTECSRRAATKVDAVALKKIIDEVFDQRYFDAQPLELRRLLRGCDGSRTHNSRMNMYSESAVNDFLAPKKPERSMNKSRISALGRLNFEQIA